MLFVLIFCFFFFISIQYPDYSFWIALTLFVDPGGLIQTYIPRSVLGGIKITDVNFVLLMLPLISPKIKITTFFSHHDNTWIFSFLLAYAIIYHISVYGFIMQGGNFSSFMDFMQYQRLTIWGFLVVIPAYIFFSRSSHVFFKFAVISSVLAMLAFIITLSTSIDLVPIWEFERSRGSGIMRISMISYGFADWFLSIFFVSYFFKIKNLPFKNFITFIGIAVFCAVILTLTRRTILTSFFSIFLIYYLHQKMLNGTVFSMKIIVRAVVILGLLVTLIFILKPEYLNYTVQTIEDTAAILLTGKDSQGEVDGRLEGDIPKHLTRFSESPFFGYGWDALWYSNDTEGGGLSANDVPLTAALGMFGVVGLLLFLPYYYKFITILINFYKVLRDIYKKYDIGKVNIMYVMGMFLLVFFITRFTVNFMSYFEDLVMGPSRLILMIFTGFLLAIRDKLTPIARLTRQ